MPELINGMNLLMVMSGKLSLAFTTRQRTDLGHDSEGTRQLATPQSRVAKKISPSPLKKFRRFVVALRAWRGTLS